MIRPKCCNKKYEKAKLLETLYKNRYHKKGIFYISRKVWKKFKKELKIIKCRCKK